MRFKLEALRKNFLGELTDCRIYYYINCFFKKFQKSTTQWIFSPFVLKIFILLIFGCAGSSLLCGLFSSRGEQGPLSSCRAQAFHCGGFSCCGAWASVVAARGLSSCGSQTLEHRLSSCGALGFQLPCRVWDLPRSGIEPLSPALAGGLFTTEPPGNLPSGFLKT